MFQIKHNGRKLAPIRRKLPSKYMNSRGIGETIQAGTGIIASVLFAFPECKRRANDVQFMGNSEKCLPTKRNERSYSPLKYLSFFFDSIINTACEMDRYLRQDDSEMFVVYSVDMNIILSLSIITYEVPSGNKLNFMEEFHISIYHSLSKAVPFEEFLCHKE
ncbi:hypothetical protein WA026_023657 [Henosepilachna vigintioctopunctata]|uniref:Uncharacterized protein n=1 Tax=Henosepilachna vigintioctopunctata TaxID=420089 RepID=A0AAW1UW30_9CUCU